MRPASRASPRRRAARVPSQAGATPNQPAPERGDERDGQHHTVKGYCRRDRQQIDAGQHPDLNRRLEPQGQPDAQCGACHRQDDTLGDQLANQPPSAGAERQSHRVLGLRPYPF